MTMIGVIGGVGFSQSDMFKGAKTEDVESAFGSVNLMLTGKIAYIPRHGSQGNIPPHMINHRANLSAFKAKGIERIIGVNSVGSLNIELAPPAILIPHDYIGLWDKATFHDKEIVHVVPGLDTELRQDICSFADIMELSTVDTGVYVQTTGPRLETKAEVAMLSQFADIVGMTMANEATLARELGLRYASICSVDNYAHGITSEPFTNEMIVANAKETGDRIATFLLALVEELK
jgi:5'-methylthioadenosine phosphorylase